MEFFFIYLPPLPLLGQENLHPLPHLFGNRGCPVYRQTDRHIDGHTYKPADIQADG